MVHMLYSYICGIYISNQTFEVTILIWKSLSGKRNIQDDHINLKKINCFPVSANVSKWFHAMYTMPINNKLELKSMRNRNLGFIFANIQNFTILLNVGKDTDLKLE